MQKNILKKINPVIAVLSIALVFAVTYIVLNESGSKTGIDMLDKKIFDDVTVDCSEIDHNILNAKVTVKVSNRSAETIHNVSVKVTAYDEGGSMIKEKVKGLDQVLEPQSSISRTVHLPKKTKRCKCILESTTTQY